jgi:hypothetical protein
MADQVSAFARLKLDIDNDENADDARGLLQVLRDRPDVSWKVREDIDRFFAEPSGQPTSEQPLPVPGWYADPTRRFELRYWDGGRWTEHVGRDGNVFRDRLSGT